MSNDEPQQQLDQFPDTEPESDQSPRRGQGSQGRLARRLIVGQTVATIFLTSMVAIGGALLPESDLLALMPLGVTAFVVGLVSYGLLQRGRLRLGGYVFSLGTSMAVTANVFVRGYQDASPIYYLWPILSASVTLAAWDGVVVAAFATISYLILVTIERLGYHNPPLLYNAQEQALLTVGSRVMMFFLLAFLAWLSNQSLSQALQRTRGAAQKWQELNVSLEQRITARTKELGQRAADLELNSRQHQRRTAQLEASIEVTRAVSSVLDPGERLNQVVHLISGYFGHYHVGVFMLDQAGRWVVLQAANSEDGQRMLDRRYRAAVEAQDVVSGVARSGEPRIAFKEGADAIYFDDVNLPDTRSEVALPLTARDQIIGVLDVHSVEEHAFDEEDVGVLSALADQIAISLDNAQLREASQTALAQLEAMQRRYVSQAWHEYTLQREATTQEFYAGELMPEGAGGADAAGGAEAAELTVPIKMRGGHVVGTLGLQEVQAGAEHGWSDDQRALVETVAEQVAQAMEAAQLFDETRRLAQRERLVAEITGKIRAAPDIDSILRTAVQEIRRALRASHGVIRLGTETHLRPPEKEK